MSKSQQFLNKIFNEVSEYGGDEFTQINEDTLINIRDIFELIKQNRFDDLKSYVNNEYAITPNKNYTYSLRDKISDEIAHHVRFIEEIENAD